MKPVISFVQRLDYHNRSESDHDLIELGKYQVFLIPNQNQAESPCLCGGKCEQRLIELEQKFQILLDHQNYLQKENGSLKNQVQYCLANLARLGITTDEQSLKDFAEQDWNSW
ncbi:MAG: hypothetical protein DSM106950_10510 [Stigonema ocellatum SAG 48.90 = DSM 106950]|nr:hypothetical protein [Stigonema ocellatum SAG 48.90 = DSM 106950]